MIQDLVAPELKSLQEQIKHVDDSSRFRDDASKMRDEGFLAMNIDKRVEAIERKVADPVRAS